jgi:hypothetical protein
MSIDVLESRAGYSSRALHFAWAHFEELLELNEACSGEAGKHIRAALEAEWTALPAGIICSCRADTPLAEQVGGGESRPSARTPNLNLADMQRAYWALPMASTGRTQLYLMSRPTHDWTERHTKAQPCLANWAGDNELAIDKRGHLVRYTETQVAELPRPEFDARHRRRVALESFGQPSRVQDSWPEPMGVYSYMADFLSKGEAEFLDDADWSTVVPTRRSRPRPVLLQAPALDIDGPALGAALERLEA